MAGTKGPLALFNRAERNGLSRRGFLKAGAVVLGGCIFPKTVLASVQARQLPERSLALFNLHTGETLRTPYWIKGEYIPEALREINHILRDFRTEEVKPIDTDLLDLLHALQNSAGPKDMLHIISGYRSPATNSMLRGNSCGIARNSLHIQGKAADIRLPGCSLSWLRQRAVELKCGGVGYYPGSDFIHVDIGRVRYW